MATLPPTYTHFDPNHFLLVPARAFRDLQVGDIFRAPSRTLTDAHASAFQAVSADNHPVHYDTVWAQRHGHTAPVVHGLQVLALPRPAQRCSRTALVKSSLPSKSSPAGS